MTLPVLEYTLIITNTSLGPSLILREGGAGKDDIDVQIDPGLTMGLGFGVYGLGFMGSSLND